MAFVRVAGESDLDAVLAVGHATWPVTYGPIAGADYVETGLARWWTAETTLPAIRDGRVLVAGTTAERVDGMALFARGDASVTIWKLYVVPEAQGQGLGAALLSQVVDSAPPARVVRLAFMAGNAAAEAFYTHHGFRVVGREPDALGGPDNVWMERALESD